MISRLTLTASNTEKWLSSLFPQKSVHSNNSSNEDLIQLHQREGEKGNNTDDQIGIHQTVHPCTQ